MDNNSSANSTLAPAVPDHIADILYAVVIPVLSVLGFVLNWTIFAVILQQSLKQTNIGIYMVVLAVVDNVILVITGTEFWRIQRMPRYSVWRDIDCKLSYVVGAWMKIFEVGLLILLTFERVVAVKYPHKYKVYFSRHFQLNRLIVLGAATFIISSPDFYFVNFSVTASADFSCQTSISTLGMVVRSVKSAVSFIIPVPFFFCGIVVILRALARSAVVAQGIPSQTVKERGRKANTLSLILVPATYSVLQLVSYVPMVILLRGEGDLSQDQKAFANLKSVPYLALTVNSSINICLYSMPRSAFRSDLIQSFKICWAMVHTSHTVNSHSNPSNQQNMNESAC